MTEKLTPSEFKEALEILTEWSQVEQGTAITKTYHFETFIQALDFMNRVAEFVESKNHHPTWTNTYNKVIVILSTHDCEGVSAKDVALAHHMDKVAYLLLNRDMMDPSDLIF